MKQETRVTQTIDRLISNLPQAIGILKSCHRHNLARQINNDLANLIYWQETGVFQKTSANMKQKDY
jgi:hypothetical protein